MCLQNAFVPRKVPVPRTVTTLYVYEDRRVTTGRNTFGKRRGFFGLKFHPILLKLAVIETQKEG